MIIVGDTRHKCRQSLRKIGSYLNTYQHHHSHSMIVCALKPRPGTAFPRRGGAHAVHDAVRSYCLAGCPVQSYARWPHIRTGSARGRALAETGHSRSESDRTPGGRRLTRLFNHHSRALRVTSSRRAGRPRFRLSERRSGKRGRTAAELGLWLPNTHILRR